MRNYFNKNISIETMSAIFIIALISMLIFANIFVGFILPLYVAVMLNASLIAIFFPKSGLYSIIFLTFIFERHFTLQTIVFGREEYKLYPLDIVMIAIIFGIFANILIGKIRIQFKKVDFILLLFCILIGAYFIVSAYIFKNDFALAFSSLKYYTFYAMIYFMTSFLLNGKDDLNRLIKFTIAGAISITFFITYGIVSGTGLWTQYTPLTTDGSRILAATHAFYLSLIVLAVFSKGLVDKLKWNPIYYLTPVWIIGIIGSLMRNIWLGLFLGIAILYLLIPKEKKEIFRKNDD